MLTPFDHLFAFVLIVAFPMYATVDYRRWKRRRAQLAAAGAQPSNVLEYRWTIAIQWALVVAMLASWLLHARPVRQLGIALPPDGAAWNGWGFLAMSAFTIALTGFAVWQARAVRRSEALRASLREQLKATQDLLPSTPRELRWFYGVSITAGVCEELLYRAWMIWYLAHAMNLWLAVVASAAIFGVAHAYQGAGGVAKVAVIGLITATLYVISGSLWLPMLLHTAIDILSGRMAFELQKRDRDALPGASSGGTDADAREGYDQGHASARTSAA